MTSSENSLCCSENSLRGSSISFQFFRFDGERTGELELLVGLKTSKEPRGSLGNDGLIDDDDEEDGDFFKCSIAN